MTTQPQSQVGISPEEYLARERQAEVKSEYYDGEVFAMSGASRPRNLIVTNLIGLLWQHLSDRDGERYPSDMRVKADPTGRYTYPDVVVVCGAPVFEDEQVDTLLNPTVLVEVLSASTEAYDRGKKFEHYRKLEMLQSVVIVAQDEAHAERFTRQSDGQWLLGEASGLDATLHLALIDVTLPLADIYDKVSFEDEETEA